MLFNLTLEPCLQYVVNLYFTDIDIYSYKSCIIKLQATLKVFNAKGFSKPEVKHQALLTVVLPST